MKNLYLLTTGFPYPAKSMETYLETEVKFYDKFDTVKILAMGVRKNTVSMARDIDGKNIKIYPIIFSSILFYLLNGITALFDKNFYSELKKLSRRKLVSLHSIARLVIYISRSHSDCRKIVRILGLSKKNKIKDGVLYTYRFEYQPYVACLLKKYFEESKIISRAHRYDLYEESNSDKYIPMREFILNNMSKVYLISENGKEYLGNKYPEYKDKMVVSKLGTSDNGVENYHKTERIRIVSCSNIVKVKRVDALVECLSKIDNINIDWVHFGGGEGEKDIKLMAEKMLGSNISYDIKGKVDNKTVLDYYKNNIIDIFINLSASEGIPVSIMEAISFGIPCIATNVGGTGEIVYNNINGFLLDAEFRINDVVNIIENYNNMSYEEIMELRHNARKIWENNYSAENNYKSFIQELI